MRRPQRNIQRPYRDIGFLFLLLVGLVIAGFTPPVPNTPFFGYFSQLGGSREIPAVIHIHASSAIAWFVVLCMQAFLMRADRRDLHRLVGWGSVAIALVVVVTAVQVIKHFYANALTQMPRDTVLSLMAQQFSGLSLFIVFYTLALLRRRRLHQHVAFLTGAALSAATPGLARLGLYTVGGFPGILLALAVIYGTLVGCMLFAKLRYRQPLARSPYLPVIVLFLLAHALDIVGSRTQAWRWFADKIVSYW